MKKLFFVLALNFVVADVYSQVGISIGPGGYGIGIRFPMNNNKGQQQGDNIEHQVQRMKGDLNLNDSEVVKVRSLLVERDRMKSDNGPMTGKQFDDRMQAILTDEQYDKFSELVRQHQQQYRDNNSGEENKKQFESNKDSDDVYK